MVRVFLKKCEMVFHRPFCAYRKSYKARIAQLVERILGKDEVIGPIPITGSISVSTFLFNIPT